ncbi:hypothetical protein [Helicobacter canis]|uniref:Uncharacterized protein n=1 Tax=Helicobacter canis TaxID=29419 RepID=A0A377J7Z6_9HELI|nr:hypothetical protein [Helicobacter canis]STO97913.1 Uncharacterised protein [Helicobacter canis]
MTEKAFSQSLFYFKKLGLLTKPALLPHDSKSCGGVLAGFGAIWGGSYLSGNDYPQIAPIASNCSPKAESPTP